MKPKLHTERFVVLKCKGCHAEFELIGQFRWWEILLYGIRCGYCDYQMVTPVAKESGIRLVDEKGNLTPVPRAS